MKGMTMFWQATGKHLRRRHRWWHRWIRRTLNGDDGTTTAEYALITVGAAAFAGILYAIVNSDEVVALLTDLVHHALSVGT